VGSVAVSGGGGWGGVLDLLDCCFIFFFFFSQNRNLAALQATMSKRLEQESKELKTAKERIDMLESQLNTLQKKGFIL